MFKFMIVGMVLGSLLCFVLACATFFSGSPTTQQILAKIAIQQATLRAIQACDESKAPGCVAKRGDAVVVIVDDALEVLTGDEDQVITASELYSALNLVLPQDLSPADKLLVAQLTELIVAEVNARIPAEQRDLPIAEASAVLGWVREAAVLVATQP